MIKASLKENSIKINAIKMVHCYQFHLMGLIEKYLNYVEYYEILFLRRVGITGLMHPLPGGLFYRCGIILQSALNSHQLRLSL
jgi:hypothetical protein